MALVLFILIVLVCVVLGLIILVQNPKGGGLSGTLAGFNNQFMGVKQTTDVLEKGTWIFAAALAVLCIISVLFVSNVSDSGSNSLQDINTSTVPTQQAPANSQQQNAPSTLQLPDSNKK
ncbi:preprotein translocase subunit SecG [Parafilimonas sp.]|uniref:preprotein translocase subunit SecG n=1 Tax=Parafilimonas sp. TaxID=1969739 RepID=UPI0039E2751B